ncbi:MAG: GntR family transcriptional regulator [Planctomycetia bacterium]|nr:GntR family transcriptional regulator [Planctomycetia bacterium]
MGPVPMSIFRVDPSRGEPLFQQLVDAVKRAVATGALVPGDRLPSVRELARDLVINPNTIAKAFRELEGEGVTVSRPGAGTFVSERRPTMSREERRRRLQEGFEGVLTEAVPWGATDEETRKAFEDAMARLRGRRGGGA